MTVRAAAMAEQTGCQCQLVAPAKFLLPLVPLRLGGFNPSSELFKISLSGDSVIRYHRQRGNRRQQSRRKALR